jgi:hypothetical protein
LIIYDLQGREIARLREGFHSPGTYNTAFDGSILPSGINLVRLKAGDFRQIRKMVMVK